MTHDLQRVFRSVVFFILLAGLCGSASGQGSSADGSTVPITLLHLPSFGVAGNLTPNSQDIFTGWATRMTFEVVAEEPLSVILHETDPKAVDQTSLSQLPKTSGSRTVKLLAPICQQYDTQGALLTWLEGSVEGSFRMVSLLYLPEKIQLEQFRVSANFERETVILTNGKILLEDFESSLRAVVQRNLGRIVRAEKPPAEAVNDLTAAPGNQTGSQPPPEQEGDNDLAPNPQGGGEGQGNPQGGSGGPRPAPVAAGPIKIGVLPFSLELSEREEDVRKRYGRVPSSSELRARTYDWLQMLTHSQPSRLEGSPITHKQIMAPAISLAGSDPQAKEKRLAQQCLDSGVDALVFGHIYQESKGGKYDVTAYLRVFEKRRMAIYTSSVPWSASGIGAHLHDLVRDVAKKAGIPIVAGDVLLYTVKPGDWLSVIARKCYGYSSAYPLLGEFNQLYEGDNYRINYGQVIRIPESLGDFRRRSPPCSTQRASP